MTTLHFIKSITSLKTRFVCSHRYPNRAHNPLILITWTQQQLAPVAYMVLFAVVFNVAQDTRFRAVQLVNSAGGNTTSAYQTVARPHRVSRTEMFNAQVTTCHTPNRVMCFATQDIHIPPRQASNAILEIS